MDEKLVTCPHCGKVFDKAHPICCESMRVLFEAYIDIVYEKFSELRDSGALKLLKPLHPPEPLLP